MDTRQNMNRGISDFLFATQDRLGSKWLLLLKTYAALNSNFRIVGYDKYESCNVRGLMIFGQTARNFA
jgi:hypothetical protein